MKRLDGAEIFDNKCITLTLRTLHCSREELVFKASNNGYIETVHSLLAQLTHIFTYSTSIINPSG